jgi:hypothetical protein
VAASRRAAGFTAAPNHFISDAAACKRIQRTLQPRSAGDNNAGMDEYTRRVYSTEEDFLGHWFALADAIGEQVGWRPNYHANDAARLERDRLLRVGQLGELTFDSAWISHGRGGFSSLQIRLQSSAVSVTVRVSGQGIECRGK